MNSVAIVLIATPVMLTGYAYAGYPVLLAVLTKRRRESGPRHTTAWPFISITVPVYNEERTLAATLDALLAQDYPADRRQIVVVSDASSDGTDEIARSYASRGVELLRLTSRRGKTAAENAADAVVRGEIVVNVDATVRLRPGSLKALVGAFNDRTVGVASGRDVSVGVRESESNQGESSYVGYEMTVRRLETQWGSIVGASGCFYATRRHLYDGQFPEQLSRDFASALLAWRQGYRAVSVEDAICVVPRTATLRTEFRRKVRTMARGLQTLWFLRDTMNPARHGRNAIALITHKLCRWLVPLTVPGAVLGLALLAPSSVLARFALAGVAVVVALGVAGMRWPETKGRVPALLSMPGFLVASMTAGLLAWGRALRGQSNAVWEPTRRAVPVATNHPA